MAYVVKDRVKVTSTTTGTGTFTLGAAVDGYQSFSVIGDGNTTYYGITNATDWEIGIGTYTSSGTTLTRTTILGSSNSNNAVDWGAGSKDVFVTFPADATQGTVPTGDDSSVGTNLVAWTNLQKAMNAGVINGAPYNNNNATGFVSTYSLARTETGAYTGGVLAANGEIHFIPSFAPRGQKVNPYTGVVSTYSIIASTISAAFAGGVLAPNGDIHFVPQSAKVGQKVSANGVVSTYSLVYTTSGAYKGGVLAPNGDIHFVPAAANRGQKISAAGVVSTYSLVKTNAGSGYHGGVLAPNGDIHFVPCNSNVGQKISAAGVVSTYSLVYTAADAYIGGVIAANGDIHFIYSQGNRGQKINPFTGVVSTYSLVNTQSNGYYGGVLAPNGDIHFVPGLATVGQKISATGVVSTYPLAYATGADVLSFGGVLAATGEIYLAPYSAVVGQKISTGVPVNIGYALSPFFNKF